MELIKKIKNAESEAKDIIEKAHVESASLLEDAGKKRDEQLEEIGRASCRERV